MTHIRLAITTAALISIACPSYSEGFEYFAGVDATSNYVSNGISQTNGKPALQGYLEIARNGFYAGTWMSSVDFGSNDTVEIDLYLGYRNRFENGVFLDVGYAQYLYNDSGSCCGEFKLTGIYPIMKNIGLEGYLAYDPVAHNLNKSATLAYAATENLGLSATYGETDSNTNEYWRVGASYAFTDFVSARLAYYGAQTGDEGLVFTLSLATAQNSFARLLAAPFGR